MEVVQFKPPQEVVFERGIINAMPDRSLTKETAERYKVETLYDTGNSPYARAFNHFDSEGNITAQKIKYYDGKIACKGNQAEVTMFGMNLFSSGGKYLTITEGEEDAMAAYQMLKSASPNFEPSVISIPNGVDSAEKACKKAWEYINSFDNIILCFDGDDVGQKAADKISKLFGYRPKVMLFSSAKKLPTGKWELKDANDYLKSNLTKEFTNLWWRADRVQPKGVLSFKSLWDAMTRKDVNTVVPWPWEGVNKYLHGLVTGHFVVIKASPKVGKCFGINTPVRMWDGTIKMVQDINTGDLLMGDDGTCRNVLSTTTGKEEMFSIKQNKGINYTVNKSHILSVKNTDTKEKRDVLLTDYLTMPDQIRWKGYSAPILREVPIELHSLDPYFIGLWLGDGSSDSPSVTTTDAEIVAYLEDTAKGYGLRLVPDDITYSLSGVPGKPNPITQSLRKLNLFENKHIPEGMLTAPLTVRRELLAGLLDSDGYRLKPDGRGYEITQKNDILANGIVDLANSLGYRVGIKKEVKCCNYLGEKRCAEYNRIVMHGDFSNILFKLTRKKATSVNARNRDHSITGIAVSSIGEGDYYGFVLDGNHRFLLADGTVVHNTALLKEIAYHIHSTSKHNVGLIFLENTQKEIGLGLCALHMNTPISPWEIPENLEELQKAHLHMSEDDRITIFDPEDDRTVENIFNKILYFVKAHNCRYILLDHITMLSYQSDTGNERMFLDKLCADLKGLTTSLDICILAVTHVNDDGKTRGSRASVQLCESLISLERDKTNIDPIIANTTIVTVEENRWGACGIAAKLYYDKDTGRMTELEDNLDITSTTFDQ